MTATPEPPPEGWTLPEAAAALFPDAWSAAWFPDDVTAARARPGIERAPSPWSQVPLNMVASVTAAVMAGGAIPAGLETVAAACRSYGAETSQRIAAALVHRAECASSNDLKLIGGLCNGISGPSVGEVADADDIRLRLADGRYAKRRYDQGARRQVENMPTLETELVHCFLPS